MLSLELLRRRICANPYDDDLRLEYSDRLLTSGTPDHRLWAEFIRWQIAIDFRPCPVPTAFIRHHFRLFLRRPRVYYDSLDRIRRVAILQGQWGPGGRDPREMWLEEVIIDRGFVSGVQCDVHRWVRLGPRLVSEHPIDELQVRETSMETVRIRKVAAKSG